MAISLFRNEHFFLSSMYDQLPNGVETRDGMIVSSAEIGYQADKFAHDPRRRARILAMPNGFAAKSLATRMRRREGATERPGWEEGEKIGAMRWYVRQKFGRNPDVAELLVQTGDEEIIEGNKRGDRFWGAVPDEDGVFKGRNQLGLILMDTRSLLLADVDLVAVAAGDGEDTNAGEVRTWPTKE